MPRRSALSLAALSAFVLLLTATSEGDPQQQTGRTDAATMTAHCDAIEGLSTCVEYATRAEADADCVSFDGTVSDGACPTEGLSGTCDVDGKLRRYYTTGGSPNDPGYAERHCRNAMAGSFTAAP